MIRFKCPHCDKEISAGDENAGKKGRCPGCKELFVIPAAGARKPAPAPGAERRTRPSDDDEAPPRKKAARDDDDEAIAEVPRKKRPAREDEDDEEALAEAPRKRKPSRAEDDEDDDRPSRRRSRDDEDDDRPSRRRSRDDEEDEQDDDDRPRRKRSRDDEEEDDRPRRKKKRRKGPYADCPNCGNRGDAQRVYYTFGWGLLPLFFRTVRCNRCHTEYNGKHGDYNTKRYLIYFAIVVPIAVVLGILGTVFGDHR